MHACSYGLYSPIYAPCIHYSSLFTYLHVPHRYHPAPVLDNTPLTRQFHHRPFHFVSLISLFRSLFILMYLYIFIYPPLTLPLPSPRHSFFSLLNMSTYSSCFHVACFLFLHGLLVCKLHSHLTSSNTVPSDRSR